VNQHVPIDPTAPLSEAVAAGKAAREAGKPNPLNMFTNTGDPIETIYQAVGAASMCWEAVEKAGVFDEKSAIKVCDNLIERLKEQGVIFP